MENQRKTITFGPVGKYDNLNPQVEPVRCKYADMVAMRDEGKLIPGQLYRITDYVTTVNEFMEPNARSAGHQFDIIVLALDATTLSEDAMAARHDGDEYFANSRLEAWELKYRLDNVQWSAAKATYVNSDEHGYVFVVDGTEEFDGTLYYRLKGDASFQEDYAEFAYAKSLEEGSTISYYDVYDSELMPLDIIQSVSIEPEEGKGTITYLKDEFENECPYDFKNIQFKRWKATDNARSIGGLNGLYVIADPEYSAIEGLTVDDEEDIIWAYTFSSDAEGGEQTDFSLGGNEVSRNSFTSSAVRLLNNVMYGEGNADNKLPECFGNSFCENTVANTFGFDCNYNAFAGDLYGNIFGNSCQSCSAGIRMALNSWGSECQFNSVGLDFEKNTWGNYCSDNSCGDYVQFNTFGQGCVKVTIGNRVQYTTFCDAASYITIESGAGGVWYCRVLNGVKGTDSTRLVLPFARNKTYTQVAALNSSGQLKIYVPGDLVQ